MENVTFKKGLPLSKERAISLEIQSLADGVFEWLGESESPESAAKLEKLEERWRAVAPQCIEGDCPSLEELGTVGLGEITRGFFRRTFNQPQLKS
jgi:hypothetical protein